MTLLITSYLILINMSASSMSLRIVTALDIWLYVCKMFVIAAMLEFGWLLRLQKNLVMRGNKKEREKAKAKEESKNKKTKEAGAAPPQEAWKDRRTLISDEVYAECRRIDDRVFVLFNAAFLVHSFVYWTTLIVLRLQPTATTT